MIQAGGNPPGQIKKALKGNSDLFDGKNGGNDWGLDVLTVLMKKI